MATDIEKLVVQLSADVRGYQREMQKARGVNDRVFNQIRRKALSSSKAVEAAVTQAGRKIAGVFAAVETARGAQQLVDSATRIQNALKVTGLAGDELTSVYDKLFAAAQRNSAPLEGLVTLYSRVSLAQKDLGVTSSQIIDLTDTVGQALRLSGASAEESSGALLQLSQALGGGTVQAEEYNSLIDGLPGVLQAAAAGIKEAGGSVSALTRLVKEGKVASKALFDGIQAGAPVLGEKLANSVQTIDQKLVNLRNSLLDAAKRFNENASAAETFGAVIDGVATDINNINFSELIGQINAVIAALNNGAAAAQNFFANAGRTTGFDNLGKGVVNALGGEGGKVSFLGGAFEITSSKIVEDRIAGAFDQVDQTVSDLTADAIQKYAAKQSTVTVTRAGRLPKEDAKPAVSPITLSDPKYAVTGKGKKAGGAGGIKPTADSRFADDIQAVKDRTAALIEEQKIVGLSYEAQERRRMALDLEQSALADLREEARKKGQTDLDSIKLSDAQREKIEAASAAYSQQADILRKLEDQQQRNEEAAGEFYDAFKSGAIDAITGAQDLGEALSGLAKRFGDLFLNAAFDSLFKPAAGGATGGPFGGIFSFLGGLLPGRERGGPVKKGQPYIVGEKRPEMFIPDQSGRIVPKVPTLASMPAAGQRGLTVNAPYAPVYNVTGNSEDIQQLRRQIDQDRAEHYSRTVQAVRKANQSGVKLGKFH